MTIAPTRRRLLACALAALALAPMALAARVAQTPAPLRIFLRGGPKTHGPADNGQHDGPTFVKEWKPLLESRGAVVEAALTFPTAEQLARTDVLVLFCANGGDIEGEQRAYFEQFLQRGGGVVALHDAVLAREPHWFKTIIGGAWENGVAKYFEGENTYYYVNTEHPITKGASNFTITDEVYWDLHMSPDANILASSMQPVRPARGAAPPPAPQIRKLIPQMWTLERQAPGGRTPYRAFVSLLGHHFTTFASPHVRAIFLRGIAWAGKRDVDSLATPEEVAALK